MKKMIMGTNHASIAVKDVGEGQPIVFLHGWPFDYQMFEYQYNYFLPRGYRIIGIDFRGFGESALVIEDYGYDTFADDADVYSK